MANTNWKKAVGTTVNGFLIKDYKREGKHTIVYAECPMCHKCKWMRSDSLKKIVSCGCYNAERNQFKLNDITNMQFGWLKAIKPTDRKASNGSVIWQCECKCGKKVFVDSTVLLLGRRVSCGCKLSYNANELNYEKRLNEFAIDDTDVKKITRKKLISTNTSGYTGVTWDKSRNRWAAQIVFKNKHYHLGRYEDKKLAIEARKAAEEHLHGDFLKWYAEAYPEKWEKLNKCKD